MKQTELNHIIMGIKIAVSQIEILHGWGRLFIAAGMKKTLSELTDREYTILSMRFGLDDGITHTLEEVGKSLGVTRDRIRQIEGKALAKIEYYNYHNKK